MGVGMGVIKHMGFCDVTLTLSFPSVLWVLETEPRALGKGLYHQAPLQLLCSALSLQRWIYKWNTGHKTVQHLFTHMHMLSKTTPSLTT